MPSIVLGIKSSINKNSIISVSQFKEQYLHGVLFTSRTGNMSEDTISIYINQAKAYLEKFLNIKINKQIVVEDKDLYLDDWKNWSYIGTSFPVNCFIALSGYIGTVHVVDYPKSWMSVKQVSNNMMGSRHIRIVPNRDGVTYYNTLLYTNSWSATYSAFSSNGRQIPNYWKLCYSSGWEPNNIPPDLVGLVGKLAAIQVLSVLSETQFSIPGLSNTTISLDGLSQSIATAVSGQTSTYSARIRTYSEQLVNDLKLIRDFYSPILMEVI